MLLDVTTLQGLCIYTLYLLHRLRFFRWRDARGFGELFKKINLDSIGATRKENMIVEGERENPSDIQRSSHHDSQEEDKEEEKEEENENEHNIYISLSNESQRGCLINDKLQPEILSIIFHQLVTRPRTMRQCMLVCRSWYELLGPLVWKSPRVLWSKHWSRFHPVSFMTTGTLAKANIDGSINKLRLQQVSRNDLLKAMSLHLIHESDQKELTQWFKWKAKEKAKRISARKQRRRLAMKRIQHGENRELDETDDNDEEDEGEDESDEDDDSDSSNGSIGALHFTEDMGEDTESDSEYDVSDDETPMMKLVSGIDYLQSIICDRKQSKQLVSSNSLLSNPLTAVIAQARRRRVAKETRIRLAQLRPFDGLPISLPLKTCGRWIQIINLQQETPYPQRINPQQTINNEPPPPQLPPLQHQGDQAPFQHHQQQQHQQQQHQLILSRQGLLSSFIDALTHNRFEDDEQFGRRATGRSTRTPVRLRSRREFITDKSLQTILENCPRLCRLTISECHGVTDEGLKLIRDSECVAQGTLISLHMAGCYQITDQGLLNLVRDSDNQPQPQLQPRPQSSPQFESLDLAGCYRITDQGLSPLLRQCGTRLLQMRVHDCINITSESVITLSEHCPRIQWLDLGHSGKLTEAGLVQLASSCSELEWLSLARHHPDSRRDSGIHLHEGLADEQEGQEGNHESETTETNHQEDSQEEEEEMLISDRAVGLICECCPKLHLLDLSYVSTITNDAIESLSKTAKSLVYLTIIGCPGITSQSLYYLARLRNTSGKLSCITMGDALGISEKEIEQIMQGTLSGWQKSMVDETILGNILGRNWH